MAHWYSVYHNENYEAEIQVGLYDQWLRQLEYGPTQADRVLVHTDMMEHAHERRFAACEARIDMSHFDSDHSRRVEQAISHLQAHFAANTSREVDDPEIQRDDTLIGLSQNRWEHNHHDCSQFATQHNHRVPTPMRAALQTMAWQAQPPHNTPVSVSERDTVMIEASDHEDDDVEQRLCLKALTEARRKSRYRPTEGARQQRTIRYRRHLISSAIKAVKKDTVRDGATQESK